MTGRYNFGHKPMKNSWDSSEYDQEAEGRKAMIVLLGVIVVMIILAFLMWWIKQ